MDTKSKTAKTGDTTMTQPEKKDEPSGTQTAATTGTEAVVPVPPPSLLSAEEIQDLKEQAARSKEHWENLLRTTADFENFKKRVARERQESSKYAYESILKTLIPVMDNLDMALAAAGHPQSSSAPSLQAGVGMIAQQLKSALAEVGLEEIDATNQAFDPHCHEAVSQQETAEVPEGRVVQQLRKGYKLRDRLLRPASVVVAKRPAV